MQKMSLQSVKRAGNETASEIRATRRIPAVVYGHGLPSTSLTLDYSEFLRVFRVAGSSHIIELSVEGKKQNVLAYQIQRHHITDEFTHVDFLIVSATDKVTVNIPLSFVGESEAVKLGTATLAIVHHSVEVKCLPVDLVDSFEVDLSTLKEAGDVIHVGGLGIDPKKYALVTPENEAVAVAEEPRGASEEDTVAVAAPAAAAAE